MCPANDNHDGALRAVFLHCPGLEQHPYPATCPFNTSRAGQVRQTVASMGLLAAPGRRQVTPAPADRDALARFHTPRYLDVLATAADTPPDPGEALAMGLGTADCPIFPGMYEYSALACGASLAGAELILAGQADVAFNPSGGLHHAFPARASGFCYMNDVALACMRLADGGKRVLYLDVDAHHGDGVQAAFYDRRDVMTISMHQDGRTLFPGTGFVDEVGTGEGLGYSVNVPLPPGTYDGAFLRAVREVALPLATAYEPDVFVMELGMDGLAGDPLTAMSLTNNAHVEVIEAVRRFSRPTLAVGGGGYNIPNTVRAWVLAWAALCGEAGHADAMSAGLGGVMLGNTDFRGGLPDRAVVPDEPTRQRVDAAIDETIASAKANVFSLHGLK